MSEDHRLEIWKMGFKWYVVDRDNDLFYLRTDGVIRQAVIGDDEPTGWFDTKEDAEAAIEKWKQLQEMKE